MLLMYQQTINSTVTFKGIGLHSGKISNVKILPAKEDTGIIFKRVDLNGKNLIKANFENVSSAKLCTTLKNKNGATVSTVEHLLAALYIAEIDNAIIEIDNTEVPIMDGSSKKFLEDITGVGVKILAKKRKYLKILEKVEFKDGSKKISISPSTNFIIDFKLNYSNKIIGKQKNVINLQTDDLVDLSNSRTFCLFDDIEKIKKIGLAKGGSLENAIVVNNEKVLNDGGLRNKKEFVNHKILDLVGDFLLSEYRVIGKVECSQGGHQLTNSFLRKLLKSNSAIMCAEVKDLVIAKNTNSNQSVKLAVNA